MASIAFPGYNPVPLGQAGSGEAFVLQGGGAPLATLQRQDALAQRQRFQMQALRQKQEGEDFKNFTTAGRLNTKGFLPWQSQIDSNVPQVYDRMTAIAQNPALNRFQKSAAYQKEIADHNGLVNLTNEVEQKVNTLRQTAKADKRYNPQAVETSMFKTFQGENGTVDARQYDPAQLEKQLENPDNYDKNEVVKQFINDTFTADQSAVATAARVGRTGRQTSVASNLFVVDDNGKLLRDPKTSLPILKTDNPEAVAAADNDPFMKRVLDQMQQQHEAQVEGVMQKMQSYEPLSDAERLLIGQEAKAPKTRADFLNELVIPRAYQRTRNIETAAKAAPRPRAGAAGTQTVTVAAPGQNTATVGVTTGNGESGFQSLATFSQPFEEKKGEKKPVIMKQTRFANVTISVPGEKSQHYANLQEGQDLQLGQPHLFLTSKSGTIYNPLDIDVRRDPKRYEEWAAKQLRAKPGQFRFAYHIEAHPDKGQNGLGSEAGIAGDITSSYAQQAGGAGNMPAMPSFGGGSSRKQPSGSEIGDKARRIQRSKNATYYILYEGNNKALIDGRTPGYRQQYNDMQAAATRLNGLAKQAPATGGLYNRKSTNTNSNVDARGGAY